METDLDSEGHVESQAEKCAQYAETLEKDVYEKTEEVLLQTRWADSAPCIINELKSSNFTDIHMKQAVVSASELLTDFGRKVRTDEIQENFEKVFSTATNYCIYGKEFVEVFDEIFKKGDSSSEEGEDPVGDYCTRKYVIDKNLIDTSVYKIILNPKNLDISTINCEESLKTSFKYVQDMILKTIKEEDKLDEKKVKCAIDLFRQENFNNNFAMIGVMSELNLTDEQKKAEKKRFIDFMGLTMSKVSEC